MIADPTFGAVSKENRFSKQMHMIDMDKETCLMPTEENEERITANKFNFVTECLFMTHKAIDLGMQSQN